MMQEGSIKDILATTIIEMVSDRMLPDVSTLDGKFFRMGDLFTIDE